LIRAARAAGWTGDDESFIDASVNLNPLGPPTCLKEVLLSSYDSLLVYPDPSYGDLVGKAAHYHHNGSVDYVFGNGADELIFALARMLVKSWETTPGSALVHIPCYTSYIEALKAVGLNIITTYRYDDLLQFSQKIDSRRIRCIWLGAPNNPDGELPEGYPDSVITVAERNPGVFYIIDEAFIDFSNGDSLLQRPYLPANILVIRSLTKIFTVPGLRIGYAVLSKQLGTVLRKELPNWPLNALAELFAQRIFKDPKIPGFITATQQLIKAERERVLTLLTPFYEYSLSRANFFIIRPRFKVSPVGTAGNAGVALRYYALSRGIALRDCSNIPGLGEEWSRIGLRRPEENNTILKTLLTFAEGESSQSEGFALHLSKKRAKALMIQGCSSSAGKSILVSALCRIMRNRGFDVAPYKAQNMSNNSAVSHDGLELGRAQAVQALACGLLPDVRMNPVLIKPEGDSTSQIILNGKPWGRRTAWDYYADKTNLVRAAQAAYDSLASEHELIILEGAGSPAEINLKAGDFVNMQAALHAEANVYLVGDIDRGGVFAAFLGHLATFDAEERRLLKGFIINKFRGDLNLLKPAYELLKGYTNIPIVGCIPYYNDIFIPEEDEHRLLNSPVTGSTVDQVDMASNKLAIGILQLPHGSNFTDFEAFVVESDVTLIPVQNAIDLEGLDALIIPGTKTTIGDLLWLEQRGLAEKLVQQAALGMFVFGICGGYQMLGTWIRDPEYIESRWSVKPGLGLLPLETEFYHKKNLYHGSYTVFWPRSNDLEGPQDIITIRGYEIHHGQTRVLATRDGAACFDDTALFPFMRNKAGEILGYWKDSVMGTYLHGVFDNDHFRTAFLNMLRRRKNLALQEIRQAPQIDRELQKLADLIEANCDIDRILNNLGFK
jgi:cobyric acid synthase CobQ